MKGFKNISLLWRIFPSTSIALTLLFAITGWMVQTYAVRVSQRSIEGEIRTSLEAYKALWRARVHTIAAVSRILSSMSDVRAAFTTGDNATIRDTAEQLWSQISEQDAIFLVLDPTGKVIASLGGDAYDLDTNQVHLTSAMHAFPKQVEGYVNAGSRLYYVVLTPVYVQSSQGSALLNVLLVAVNIDAKLADTLKQSIPGSDFAFESNGTVKASTLQPITAAELTSSSAGLGGICRLELARHTYLVLGETLEDIERRPIGKLFIIRSFADPERTLSELQRRVGLIWFLAVIVGLGFTYLLARRIVEPIKRLDRAAGEVIKQNYDYRVPVETNDELGRLAHTFNTMCESIQRARNDLIRQERIATIGRFASSIVHDLRSPLAAIYGGAEMLVDTNLSAEQTHRLAANLYRASRRIQELLQDLTDLGRAGRKPLEMCRLVELINAAIDSVSSQLQLGHVSVTRKIPEAIQVPVERGRVERVFTNLLTNALEAMPNGGDIDIIAWQQDGNVLVQIRDTGPGLSNEAWANLFEPFATFGKRNGLGLGLALSRQTILDHGGDLWAEKKDGPGAVFCLRLPITLHSGISPGEGTEHENQKTSAIAE